jgi:hypothetical protein
MTHKNRKKIKRLGEISYFEVLNVLRAEGFSCSLDILYGVLGLNSIFDRKI